MLSVVFAITAALSSASPGPTSQLLSNSPLAQSLGITVLLAASDKGHVIALGNSVQDVTRAIGSSRPAMYVPFDGQPATPFVAARGRQARPLSLGMKGCDRVPSATVGLRAPVGKGLLILGAAHGLVRWLPADRNQTNDARSSARIRGLSRACVSLGGPGQPNDVELRLRAEAAEVPCTDAPSGPVDAMIPWWDMDDNTMVTDIYGVLELGTEPSVERWLIIESNYIEATGLVAIDLSGAVSTTSATVVCGGVATSIGKDDRD